MDAVSYSPDLLAFSKTRNPAPPMHLGRRYDRDGNFLPEPGNTVVCHLQEGSRTEKALIDARARYLAMPDASRLTFTPISSLHMTLFQGIIEYRRALPFWPEDIALDTPIDEMTARFLERLEPFAGRKPFRVQVTKAKPTGLVVEGVTDEDCRAMMNWRNAFANIFGYRHPDHETYEFHITFSYVVERLDDVALPTWQGLLDEIVHDIREHAPVLELRPPAFCTFNDMNHFEELRVFNLA
ncbi:MAG: DUF1868 domain-containing protein [Phyllobacterium sp.]